MNAALMPAMNTLKKPLSFPSLTNGSFGGYCLAIPSPITISSLILILSTHPGGLKSDKHLARYENKPEN